MPIVCLDMSLEKLIRFSDSSCGQHSFPSNCGQPMFTGFDGWIGLNTLRPRQNGRHFPGDIFKWIFFNENVWISINISLKFVPRGPINNIPTLVQVMAWRRSGDKPLSEPMIVRLPTHICVTRPQWVKSVLSPEMGGLGIPDMVGHPDGYQWVNTLRPRQNGRHFEMHFLEWKCIKFDWDFTEVCTQGSNQQYSSIGSDNGLAPAGDKPLSEPMLV